MILKSQNIFSTEELIIEEDFNSTETQETSKDRSLNDSSITVPSCWIFFKNLGTPNSAVIHCEMVNIFE